MLPKVKYLILTILFALASYNLYRTTMEIYQSSQRLEQIKADAASIKEENKRLKVELAEKQTPEFVEAEARNKLNMVRPGEKLIIPVGRALASVGEAVQGIATEAGGGRPLSNAEKWFALFFDSE